MLDLFSGIGGFSYAGEKLVGGYETVAFCEYDKHAQKVLRKHWPDTEIIDDVRELANDADRFRGMVDVITGGYPCQPFSLAGVRRGDKDDRHLWPEMLRIIQAVRPTWVIGENVAGHVTLGLDTVLSDLEGANYTSRCFVIPAVAADAPHRRDRCWIVAHTDRNCKSDDAARTKKGQRVVANAIGIRREWQPRWKSGVQLENSDTQPERWQPEPAICRVVNGLPNRSHRVRQLGNSIVPQVAARILWAIREAHEQT
jgi:DNA (cytosine-5)-methyltransferase 1